MEILAVVTDGITRTVDLTGASTGSRITIGRSEDNDVVLEGDARASREHAVLTNADGVWRIADRNSMNGTYVNSVRISAPVEVGVGDLVNVGSTAITIAADDAKAASHRYIDLDARTDYRR